ncbi:hypothetical protein [Arcobacter sp. YIC-80]|uniref:hypothetical protein n=1 Tax=unclassified Arcobacter TaxID=2593671 RepID=UPI00384BB64D
MNTKYKPVACHFYDELESAAVKRTLNKIIFINDKNQEETIEDLIVDFKTIKKEEFAILKSGLQIRLDKIINFNELNPKDY